MTEAEKLTRYRYRAGLEFRNIQQVGGKKSVDGKMQYKSLNLDIQVLCGFFGIVSGWFRHMFYFQDRKMPFITGTESWRIEE